MNVRFEFTTVYGLHTVEDRRKLWRDLLQVNSKVLGAWIIMGDFNAIRSREDRPIGNLVQEMEVKDFNKFVEDAILAELRTNGRSFTWTNGHTYSRIDRALVNAEWMLKMPHLGVCVMDSGCSDHSPLSITFEDKEESRPKPFKFLNHLADHKDFIQIVNKAWKESSTYNKMRDVWERLKKVKQAMKKLNADEYNCCRRKDHRIQGTTMHSARANEKTWSSRKYDSSRKKS
ncbi:PREDICTED: uncharacterized protein LOC109222588 [Nicotiana attenuata]|uniref:uncharacterized protein LOC109222588 n=1 Tax=Nicotiana attenuata TaxID=49451 RepID=UPI0009051435|nr:PREDICTED: uncharacterized protein LOC109222588 [Nicotiana attenuata]